MNNAGNMSVKTKRETISALNTDSSVKKAQLVIVSAAEKTKSKGDRQYKRAALNMGSSI